MTIKRCSGFLSVIIRRFCSVGMLKTAENILNVRIHYFCEPHLGQMFFDFIVVKA